jgi:hypothetical protein
VIFVARATTTMTPVARTQAAMPSSATKMAPERDVLSQPELESIFFTTLHAASPLSGFAAGSGFCSRERDDAVLGGSAPEPVVVALALSLCDAVGDEDTSGAVDSGGDVALVGACAGEAEAGGALATGAAEALAGGGGAAFEDAEADGTALVDGDGAALGGGALQGVTGGAVNVPALDARFGSGSALFE